MGEIVHPDALAPPYGKHNHDVYLIVLTLLFSPCLQAALHEETVTYQAGDPNPLFLVARRVG